MEPLVSNKSDEPAPSNASSPNETSRVDLIALTARAFADSPINTKTAPEQFDFCQPAFLPRAEMRNLREHHAEFLEALTTSLASYLGAEVLVEITKLQTLTYHDFVASVRTPAHLTLLKVEPLRGVCIVDVDPKLGLAMVDRLLGGLDVAGATARDLSEIETVLLDQIVQLIVGEWCNTGNKAKKIRPLLLGHENTAQYLQTSPPETTMLVIAMKACFGECEGQIQVVFPWYSVEPRFGKFTMARFAESTEESRDLARPRWRPEFAEIPLHVTAQGPAFEIAARDLAALQPGDMLDLDPHFANQINVRVGDITKFTGRLGFADGMWAIEITTIQNI